jgi:hypothetical protein
VLDAWVSVTVSMSACYFLARVRCSVLVVQYKVPGSTT